MSARWTSADLENLKAMQAAKPKPADAKAKAGKKAKAQIAGLTGAEAIEARRNATVLIGIDPGTHTGIAIKEHGAFVLVETITIYQAINDVKNWTAYNWNVFIRIEDARQRKWFGKTDRERLKGAGSVERDCKIWEEVLTELKIPFEFVHPKHVKATTAEQFEKLTGWKGRTSIHAREAAWLII